jgi:hypothetical protein
MSSSTNMSSLFYTGANNFFFEKNGDILLKDANFLNLTNALCYYFNESLFSIVQTNLPQAKYAEIVVNGLKQLDFFKFVSNSMFNLYRYLYNDFAKFTVLAKVGSFSKVTKEEYLENKDYYLNRVVLEQQLKDVQPIELIRAVRLVLQQLLYRFFHTYDVDEKREVGKKLISVCNPSNATFIKGERRITTEEFCEFLEELCSSCRIINAFTPELCEFRDVFKSAATTAKQMRLEFHQKKQTKKETEKQSEKQSKNQHQSSRFRKN